MKEFTQINWHTIQADESAELLESGPVPSAPLVLAPIQNIIPPIPAVLYAAIANGFPFLAVASSCCDIFPLSTATDLWSVIAFSVTRVPCGAPACPWVWRRVSSRDHA